MAIRLTESKLRQIVREEARRLREASFTGSRAAGPRAPRPRGPFTSEDRDVFGFDELLDLFMDFAYDSPFRDAPDEIDPMELIEAFLENNGLHGRVSAEWNDAAYARLMSELGEMEGDFEDDFGPA